MQNFDTVYKIILKGFVQDVGFRSYVHYYALKYNISGYVRNLSDGNLEIIAIANKDDYNKFEEYVLKGPAGSEITGIVKNIISESNINLIEGFKIQ